MRKSKSLDIRFDSLGAFTYSREEDTKSYDMDEQVDEEIKESRYENDKTFNDTVEFVKDIRFDSLGAFTYSKEEDTKSYDIDKQVDEDLKQQRYETLMSVQQEIIDSVNESRIGNTYEVLIERYEPLFDRYVGRSYMSAPDGIDGVVYIRNEDELKIGEFYQTKIVGYKDYDLIGEIIYE